VMDNLSSHKVDGVRQRIEARGCRTALSAALLARPEPHRKAWSSSTTAPLRQGRTEKALDQAITEALQEISAENAQAWFRLTLNWVQL